MHRSRLKPKACPRCCGDIFVDRADEEPEEVCIQCGYRKYIRVTDNARPETALEQTDFAVTRLTKEYTH
jgi:predicted  nucleic acid-binding Zn-ribbon protein